MAPNHISAQSQMFSGIEDMQLPTYSTWLVPEQHSMPLPLLPE